MHDAVLMQFDHQFHIFAHGSDVISAAGDDHILFEKPEGAGNDQGTIEFIKENSAGQKRTVIFQHLHTGQEFFGKAIFFYPSIFQFHIIGSTDRTAYRNHMVIFQNGANNFLQGIILENGIGVHADEIGETGGIDAHIQGIGLSSILFAHPRNGHLMLRGLKNEFFRLPGKLMMNGAADGMHIKCFNQHFGGIIRRTVIHNNDFIGTILQLQQGFDRFNHRYFFIMRRNNDRNGHIIIFHDGIFQLFLTPAAIEGRGTHQNGKEKEGGIPDEIDDEKYIHAFQECFQNTEEIVIHPSFSFRASLCSRR